MYYQFTDNLSEEEFEDELGEMCHIWKKDFNLPYRIIIDSFGKFRQRKDNSPRIFVDLLDDYSICIPVSINKENPEILIELRDKNISEIELIFNWVKSNYEILMRHWNREISDFEALDCLEIKGKR